MTFSSTPCVGTQKRYDESVTGRTITGQRVFLVTLAKIGGDGAQIRLRISMLILC
jgi:hypothetical protein